MTKDELENSYVQGFSKTIPDFPSGRLLKSENPDFVISTDGSTTGVELTRIFRRPPAGESPLREQESLRERIARRSKVCYDASGQPPIHVSILFNDQVPLRRRDVETMAQRLLDLAVRLMPPVGERREEEYNWINREYFPESISWVAVYRPDWLRQSTWSTPSTGYLPRLSFCDVQALITTKDTRVPDYLKRCDRIWLVLCTYGEGLSSYVDLSEEAMQGVYQARFTRVFAYRWPSTVHELALQRGT